MHFCINQIYLTYIGRILINVKLIQPRVTFESMLTLSVAICAGYLTELQSMHPYVTGVKKQLHNLTQTPPADENPWHRQTLEQSSKQCQKANSTCRELFFHVKCISGDALHFSFW